MLDLSINILFYREIFINTNILTGNMINSVVNKAANSREANLWDIKQQKNLSSEERQAIARELKRRVYGENPPDVSEAERNK